MRYELSDYEWTAIKPMLPNKPRGVRRVNDRRVLNGIFWVLRSGAPWRDLPENYGPCTTCYNRFVRWRRAGVWDRIMDALAAGCNAAVQMIDTSVVRVHQHGACIADNSHQDMGRSRGGLTSKIHAVVDTNGLPVHLALTPGEAHDNRLCSVLLNALLPQTMLLADRGYDADWIRELARHQGAWANIPPKRNRNLLHNVVAREVVTALSEYLDEGLRRAVFAGIKQSPSSSPRAHSALEDKEKLAHPTRFERVTFAFGGQR